MFDPVAALLAGHPIASTLWIASLVHVGIESVKKKRVGRPFWHIAMVGLVIWPIGYLIWVFYWPGTLLKSKTQRESEEWVERISKKKKTR